VIVTQFLAAIMLAVTASTAAAAAAPPQQGDVAVRVLADKRIEFTLITASGHVGFSASKDWSVIAMKSRLPVTATAFQIPDPSDAGTPDSTNLVISLYQPSGAEAELTHMRSSYAGAVAKKHGAWNVYTRQINQGSTSYTIIDAEEPCADVICGVRVAWPHLPSHAGYDEKMQGLFETFLDSIEAQSGAYQLHPDEVLRRPD
jgi:hypothetical protein